VNNLNTYRLDLTIGNNIGGMDNNDMNMGGNNDDCALKRIGKI